MNTLWWKWTPLTAGWPLHLCFSSLSLSFFFSPFLSSSSSNYSKLNYSENWNHRVMRVLFFVKVQKKGKEEFHLEPGMDGWGRGERWMKASFLFRESGCEFLRFHLFWQLTLLWGGKFVWERERGKKRESMFIIQQKSLFFFQSVQVFTKCRQRSRQMPSAVYCFSFSRDNFCLPNVLTVYMHVYWSSPATCYLETLTRIFPLFLLSCRPFNEPTERGAKSNNTRRNIWQNTTANFLE